MDSFNQRKYLSLRLKNEKGGVLVALAVALPITFIGILYTLDSCRLLNKRMNLLHAGDEASLAIATTGNLNKTEEEKRINKDFVRNYLSLYLPDAIEFPVIRVEAEEIVTPGQADRVLYGVEAKARFNTYLPTSDKTIKLTYGGASHKSPPLPADYIIAIDASFGWDWNYLTDVNVYVKASKEFIPEFAQMALDQHPDNRIAIMPHDTAVPLRLKTVSGDEMTNERGGPALGCGYLFAPKPDFDLTYSFWAQQPFYRSPTAANASDGSYYKHNDLNYQDYLNTGNINYLTYEIDKLRYEYYEKYVLRSIDPVTRTEVYIGTMDQLADGQIPQLVGKVKCDKNPAYVE
jgi:hypothetical protein